jgi:hypothetical protein
MDGDAPVGVLLCCDVIEGVGVVLVDRHPTFGVVERHGPEGIHRHVLGREGIGGLAIVLLGEHVHIRGSVGRQPAPAECRAQHPIDRVQLVLPSEHLRRVGDRRGDHIDGVPELLDFALLPVRDLEATSLCLSDADLVLELVSQLHVGLVAGIRERPNREQCIPRSYVLLGQRDFVGAVVRRDRMILADDHERLIPALGLRKRDAQRGAQVEDTERVERVPVAPDRDLLLHVVGLPRVGEPTEAVVLLDVALHLEVRLGAHVVVRGDLRACVRRRPRWSHQQEERSSDEDPSRASRRLTAREVWMESNVTRWRAVAFF